MQVLIGVSESAFSSKRQFVKSVKFFKIAAALIKARGISLTCQKISKRATIFSAIDSEAFFEFPYCVTQQKLQKTG